MDFCIYRCRGFNVVNLKFGPAEIGSSCVRSRYSVGFVGFCFLPWAHAVTHLSPAHAYLRPQAHFQCHYPALKLRRSDPCNLFPCDWLLYSPERGRGERENMGWEKRFNMTKPVPGDPLFSPDPRDPLLFFFSPPSLDPCPPFFIYLFEASPCPLQPSNANSPFLPPIFTTCFLHCWICA